jgi:phosphohistidine phosphatase
VREYERRLVVMRHAKAEATGISDHARELTGRGTRDATEAGLWARTTGAVPDHAFVSSAARTRATWSAFCEGAELELEPELDPGLYSAGVDAALEVLRSAPADARTVMIVGHNPTMAQLVHLLDDGGSDPATFERLSAGYPTSALTVLGVPDPWDDLDLATARIVDFHVGRAD